MGERSILFQFAVVTLLVLIAALLALVVIQNEDTQRKLEELRTELRTQAPRAAAPPEAPVRTATASSGPMAPAPLAEQPLSPGAGTVAPGPDGVEEYSLAGLRVRRDPYRNPKAQDGDRLLRSYQYDPPGLNPIIFNEAMCSTLFGLCNDVLATRDFDDPERWVPQLASGWAVTQTVRIHLKAGADAAKLVAGWEAEADGAAARAAADIVGVKSVDPQTIELTTNSVRGEYAVWLEKRLPAGAVEPAQYLAVSLNPKFPAPAGQPAPTLDTLAANIAQTQGGWRVVDQLPRSSSARLYLVLGDAAGLAAKWTQAFQAASPGFDAAKPESLCGKVEPVESQPYEVRPVVTFTLRRGAHWQTIADPRAGHQGEIIAGPEITAADWDFTFNKIIRNPQVPCEHIRNYLQDLASVQAVDSRTVQFAWFRPYFQLFTFSAGFTVLPRHIFGQEDLDHLELSKFNRVICGSGAWRLDHWKADTEIVLARNPDYWGVQPHLTQLNYQIVKDPTVNLSLFREGKLDALTLTPDQWKENASTPEFLKIAKTESGVANSYRYIGYNERIPLFKDKTVRRAMTMLIDRQAIIDKIFNGMGVPLSGPFHPQTPNYDPAVEPLPFDLAGAKALLRQAGWVDTDDDGVLDRDHKPFKYTLLYPGGRPEYDQIATFIQQGDAKAGIQVELVKLEWSSFLDRVVNKQDFEACILGWQLGYEADPYQLWHSSQTQAKESNFCGFVNARADEIIVQGRYMLDPQARQDLYREFHRLIADQQPYSFLFVSRRMNAYAARYEDVKYTLLDTDFNRWYVPAVLQK